MCIGARVLLSQPGRPPDVRAAVPLSHSPEMELQNYKTSAKVAKDKQSCRLQTLDVHCRLRLRPRASSPHYSTMDAFFTVAPPITIDEPTPEVLVDREDGSSGDHSSCTIA